MKLLNPLFLIPIITGAIFIAGGFIMLKFPPKNINSLYGYRTNSSMKSAERWDFAQIFSAMETIRSGGILISISFLGLFFKTSEFAGTVIALGSIILIVIQLLMKTEKAIKEKFG